MPTSLRPVFSNLQKLAKTSSTNDKIVLLREFLEDKVFKQVIRLAYNQTYKYNVKSFPEKLPAGFHDKGWEFVLPILKELVRKQGADQAIKMRLFQAASIDPETFEIVKRICSGDLKCGIGGRLINTAVPGTVKIYAYMRCATSKHINKIDFESGAYVQCKADGSFANMVLYDNGSIDFITRNGQKVQQLEYLKAQIKEQPSKLKFGSKKGTNNTNEYIDILGKVFHGELRVFRNDGSWMSRKEGNGIINQCIKGTANPSDAKRVFFTTWDSITIDEFYNGVSDIGYQSRFFRCIQLVNAVDNNQYIRLVESEVIYSRDDAYSFFRKMRSKDEEGAIVKNPSGIWEDNQSGSHDNIKLKHSFECDVRVVGWNYGKKGSKFESMVGSVIVESECGKLRCSVSGLLDSEREWDWDMMIDSIVSVEAESVIESKSKSTFALYTPSFLEVREDKEVADTLEEIIEIAKESKKTRRYKNK